MRHLTDEQLSAHLDAALRGPAADEAARHLAECAACREALAALAAQDAALRPALAHDPGEAYFERFAARVEERIAAAGAAPAPRGRPLDLGRFFRTPRALAWAGGVAVVVVGGGLALMTSRDVVPPDLRDGRAVSRFGTPAPAAPAAPGATAPAPPTRGEDQVGTGSRGEADPAPTASSDLGVVPAPADPAPASPDAGRDRAATQEGFARPPAEEKERADATTPPGAGPASAARPSVPGRAREVRLNEAGEEVAVRRQEAARPAAPIAPPAAGADAGVRKKQVAEPLGAAAKSGLAPTTGATGARDEAARRAAPAPSVAPLAAEDARAAGDLALCGEVRDEGGHPVADAQVALPALGRGTTTDRDGRFCLDAPRGEHELTVMAVGFRTARRTLRLERPGTTTRVMLAAVPVLDGKGLVVGRARDAGPPGAKAPEPRDLWSTLPDTLREAVREAQRLAAEGAAGPTAARFDLAALAWELALDRLPEGAHEVEARRELADVRFLAWQAGATPRRSRAAVVALEAYLARAPAGPAREEAVRRLERLKR